jgi:hypothetical protein
MEIGDSPFALEIDTGSAELAVAAADDMDRCPYYHGRHCHGSYVSIYYGDIPYDYIKGRWCEDKVCLFTSLHCPSDLYLLP